MSSSKTLRSAAPPPIPYPFYFVFILGWLAFLTIVHNVKFITADMSVFDPEFRDKYSVQWHLVMTHGVAAMIALAIGPVQFVESWRKRWRGLHRMLGRVYIIALLLAAPTGFFMGLMAYGGLLSQSAFVVFSILWFVTACLGYHTACKRKFAEHRVWMIRSYALTFGAVILRVQLNLLQDFGFRFEVVYPYMAWCSWIPAVLIGELVVRKMYRFLPQSGQILHPA
ncbi:MAG: DUF2306 domain-containing protein [Sumerlaeia bacterium]